jgi:hypothetical protein
VRSLKKNDNPLNLRKNEREFFDTEVTLKLYREFDFNDYEARIAYVKAEAEKVRSHFDQIYYTEKLSNRIAHCYLDAEKFGQAIPYLEKEVELKDKWDSFYLFPIWLLIRCNTLIKDFEKGLYWSERAFNLFGQASATDKLNVFVEYSKLLTDYEKPFNPDYLQFIQEIIDEQGFPQNLEEPIATIQSLDAMYRKWNRKLSDIHMMKSADKAEKISLFQKYIEVCEIGWYREYAGKVIAKLQKEDQLFKI